ncbi:putative outer membrane starch-binding protein [Anseongella ginsenosidimutans]|uniref:Putative outer membrane starch-binding protein n=2 Tax=Anseongella ginsenosidimutans TaxID=496056 RepID=A0A4R3KP22_9SPHI|nr:putative outer membrane starch-binding protein [Anseongella ginsenosidimutans]
MVKIRYSLLGLIFLMSSCDKFLEVETPDNLVKDEFWQDEGQVHSSLMGLYTSLNSCLDVYQSWGDIRSSLYAPGAGDDFNSNRAEFLRHDIYPDNGLVSWSPVYRSITWINSFIKNAPGALELDENLTQAELSSMMGEARALRALNYFYLVRAFREVPLITEPYESDSQTFNTAAASEDEALDFIEEDLAFALENAPETFENVNERYGRITKNAVRALWADVKLWRNQYQACLDLCLQLDAQYAGSMVRPLDWYSIFNPGNSTESIFELQYMLEGPNSPLYNWFAHVNTSGNDRRYLANATNIALNATEVLYPPVLPEYATSDTIRLKNYAMLSASLVTNGYGLGAEVYKFLGEAPYQRAYRSSANRNANYIFYRYREVLFMKAEAYAMLGRYAEAEAAINVVREHCDIPPLGIGEGGEGTEFFSRLLMEREFELGFEGKEWFAAVRISRRQGYSNILIEKAANGHSMNVSYPVIRARLLDQESWFLPYHETELENNLQLEQKDYYQNK